MKPFLKNLWDKVLTKLGAVAAFIPGIAQAIKIAIDEGDQEKALKLLEELDESFDAGKAFTAKVRAALADGQLTAAEIAASGVALEKWVDETEDVFTLKDEDDTTGVLE